MTAVDRQAIRQLQTQIWNGCIPLEIRLSPLECRTYDDSDPYLILCPRLSYLPFLLPRLHAFFAPNFISADVRPHHGWFSCEGVPLKWQHPVGLLYDLFSGAEPASTQLDSCDDSENGKIKLPWKLTLHFSEWPAAQLIPLDADGKVHHDSFINSVKEADFLRNGTGKVIMSLSKDDSTKLWQSVKDHDLLNFNPVNQKFLDIPGGPALRSVPLKIYLPMPSSSTIPEEQVPSETARGALKVVQGLVPPSLSSKDRQTLGTALHALLPTVFPSRRSYIHAHAVLHGAVVPPAASVEDLMRATAFADGFLHVAVLMVS